MKYLYASLSGPQIVKTMFAVAKLPPFASELPVEVADGHDLLPADALWPQRLAQTTVSSVAFWKESSQQVSYRPKSDKIGFGIPDAFATVEEALAILEPLSFELGILGSVFLHEWIKADYERWGVGRSNIDHGWACIFRGAGHDRLVSRRWLDFGPWRVIRRPNDTTVIQFHDLAITDPLEAYEQAKAGHERMGNSAIGGYIGWYLDGLLEGASTRLYNQATRTLERVVPPGDVISQSEMLCNAALRLHHRTDPTSTPVEHVAYIFIDEGDARAHLHELWLREMECWSYRTDGKKHRLDLDYRPVPAPPEWVKRLDAR
jgi:hypothetical protein